MKNEFAAVLIFVQLLLPSAQAEMPAACRKPPPIALSADPYIACKDRPVYEDFYHRCLEPGETGDGPLPKLAFFERLEQLKLILDLEFAYLARVPSNVPYFQKAWAEFRARWSGRLHEEARLTDLDRDPRLGVSQCQFSAAVGLACGNNPNLDMISIRQTQSQEGAVNRSVGYVGGISLAREIVSAQLLVELARKDTTRPEMTDKDLAARRNSRERGILNQVYTYFPELAVDSVLQLRAHYVEVETNLLPDIRRQMEARERTGLMNENELMNFVKLFIRARSRPEMWTTAMAHAIEDRFAVSMSETLANLDAQLKRSRRDADWTLGLDYLLGAIRANALTSHDEIRATLAQTMICENVYARDRAKKHKEAFELTATSIALLTGAGAMFDIGTVAVTSMGLTSIGLINLTTGIDLYSAYQERKTQRDLFLLRGSNYDALADADKEFLSTIPWAVINVAMIAPPIVLEKILVARKAAQIAQDLVKVKQLDRYRKAVITVNFAVNAGLAATNVKTAIPAIKEVYDDIRSTPK